MKARLLLSPVLAGMVLALPAGAALAQDTANTLADAAPMIEHHSFEGTEANAGWFTDDTGTVVDVLDGQVQQGNGALVTESVLLVDHLAVDVDPATGAGTFTVLGGEIPLEPGQFGIDGQLRNAFVTTDATLDGATCSLPEGEECEFFTADVSISVTWTGQEGITTSAFAFRTIESDFRFVARIQGTVREATAEGFITGDVDLTSGPPTFAGIDRSSNSDILWIRTA